MRREAAGAKAAAAGKQDPLYSCKNLRAFAFCSPQTCVPEEKIPSAARQMSFLVKGLPLLSASGPPCNNGGPRDVYRVATETPGPACAGCVWRRGRGYDSG